MKQQYSFKQKQLPRLSMQTWLPLLQYSLADLDKHLQVIANDNPCINLNSGMESNEHPHGGGSKEYHAYQNYVSNSASDQIEWFSVSNKSLYEKLDDQIVAPLFPTPISQKIARQIIYNLNSEGYFEGDLQEVATLCDSDIHTVEGVRQRFAYLEPAGIGALDYRESFLFQLNEHDLDDELSILLSTLIINFESIEKFIDHPRLHDAKDILSHFRNPPTIEYMENERVIVPDLYVNFKDDGFVIRINNTFYPDITVSQIDKYENFAKQKFKEARELVKLLDLRKATLYNVTLILIEKQQSFFLGGELKPLKLQDVADILGFNESTISRAISDKYMQTDRGLISFKELFSNAIGTTATSEIKHFIERIVENEDKSAPLSDKILHEMIEDRFGIKIVRRSVAKYRQEMDIASFKDRKFLYALELV